MLFHPEYSTISAILAPQTDNPRCSEGDFLRLKDGRILFAYSHYRGDDSHDHSRCEIRCLLSNDNGVSFHADGDNDAPRILISAEQFDQINVMSVSLLRMNNGDVGLFYILKHTDQTDEYLLSRSNDECETFYKTVQVLPGVWPGYYVINNNRVERLSDGRLLVPVAEHATSQDEHGPLEGRSIVWFYCSEDDGETWYRMPSQIDMPHMAYSHTGLQEPGLIEMPNGVLYAYFRTDMGYQYESVSVDRGTHWFTPQPSRFTSPAAPLKIAQNPFTGKYYAIWNPTPNYNGRTNPNRAVWGRTPLALAQSSDGYNFDLSNIQYIEESSDHGYCYPAIFFTDETTMLCAYCSGGDDDGACLCRLTIRRIVLC